MCDGDAGLGCGSTATTASARRDQNHDAELAEVSELYAPGHYRNVEGHPSLEASAGRGDGSRAEHRISQPQMVVRRDRKVQRPDQAGKDGYGRLHRQGLRYRHSIFADRVRWSLRLLQASLLRILLLSPSAQLLCQ